jgi:ubiquinone/menaquinone biosynthesis C-methylase UbiE
VTDKVLASNYYENEYTYVANSGVANFFTGFTHRALETKSSVKTRKLGSWLELGAGFGQHLQYLRVVPESYTLVDFDPKLIDKGKTLAKGLPDNLRNSVEFKVGDCEKLTFEDNSFDHVTVTCLLHHLSDLESALMEIRRVLKIQGTASIYVSCDPGILNRILRKVIILPRAKKVSFDNYSLFIAREHRNHFASIDVILRSTFVNDKVKRTFFPFRFHSWNFNAFVIYEIRKIQIS